ncbi:hypothetical protein EPI10_023438 [Gossypium australe]|uniref:Uncharacterized protein n=1 Tax=Gossypium australe TaxID=47621 RepID=A0A5B6VVL5_9ROSI|nr:hypothetical protein EPI10_023438 [Gossypium australe]
MLLLQPRSQIIPLDGPLSKIIILPLLHFCPQYLKLTVDGPKSTTEETTLAVCKLIKRSRIVTKTMVDCFISFFISWVSCIVGKLSVLHINLCRQIVQ